MFLQQKTIEHELTPKKRQSTRIHINEEAKKRDIHTTFIPARKSDRNSINKVKNKNTKTKTNITKCNIILLVILQLDAKIVYYSDVV